MIALFKTLITYKSVLEMPTITIQNRSDSDISITIQREDCLMLMLLNCKIKKDDPMSTITRRPRLNGLLARSKVTSQGIYERSASQWEWSNK